MNNTESTSLNTCLLCSKGPFKNYAGLSKHLCQAHSDISTQEYYDRFLKKPGEGICIRCGNPTAFSGRLNRGYYTHCSKACAAGDTGRIDKIKSTKLTLHGSEGYNNHDKISATKLARYGDTNYANGDQIRSTKAKRYGISGFNNPEKRKATKEAKYGSANYVNTEKCAQTKLERHGSRTYNNQAKIHATKLKRYGDPNYLNRTKGYETYVRNTISKYQEAAGEQCRILDYTNREFICECPTCGTRFNIPVTTGYMRLFRYGIKLCTVCNPAETSRSHEENSLFDYVSGLIKDEATLKSDRMTIPGNELDIYVPSRNLAIEFDGLYWHNELRKAPTYHLRKTEACEKNGIQLIHVFEDEWTYRKDIVKSRIAGILGLNTSIFARNCELRELPSREADDFLESNHLQGKCTSKWRYGLFYENELVAVMTFGTGRFSDCTELLRFCTKKFYHVIGGASKLFRHFTEVHPEINEIVSFADRRWSTKDAFYPKLGFTLDGSTRPSYYYVVNNIRRNRMDFTKKSLVAAGFDSSMSEHDIMLSRKIYRVYDCGNWRYVWTRKDT